MDDRAETTESKFATPKVVVCTLALVYPRQAEIRRRGNEIEDALKADYGTPQVINSSDDVPQEVPRFLIPSKDGRRVITVSQSTMQMNVIFSDEFPSDLATVATYIVQHYGEIFTALVAIKDVSLKVVNPLFFGVTTQIHIPTRLPDQEIVRRLARHLLKSPEETRGGYFDVQVKQTKIIDKKLFRNVTLANYRTYRFDGPPEGVPRFPMDKVVEYGIEITGDVNDRYAYNRLQAYRTSIEVAGNVVEHTMRSLEEAIAQVEVMTR